MDLIATDDAHFSNLLAKLPPDLLNPPEDAEEGNSKFYKNHGGKAPEKERKEALLQRKEASKRARRARYDVDGDGSINAVIAYTYDANGNQLSMHHDFDNDGSPNSIVEATYDDDGNPLTRTQDFNGDGIPELADRMTYNVDGDLVGGGQDADQDGVEDAVWIAVCRDDLTEDDIKHYGL